MKKYVSWQIIFAVVLLAVSLAFYILHYIIFRDIKHIFIYFITDVAFLFIDVVIVTLVFHQLLQYREKQSILKKLNMVIGVFFSEVGTEFIRRCSLCDKNLKEICNVLSITSKWTDSDFENAVKNAVKFEEDILADKIDLTEMKTFLISKRQFLLNLLENPNLLEHETFTDLLLAVFHLSDELSHRKELNNLPESDFSHLAGDVKRAYRQASIQWIEYMKHLKNDYPYLFSLALRTNPFDSSASIIVK